MIQEQFIKKFNHLFKTNENINSALIIGSFGRKEPKANSDIDYQILVSSDFDNDSFFEDLKRVFSNNLKHSIYLKEKKKWCLYLTEDLIVTEIFICNTLQELEKYFLGSEIGNPKNAILFDETRKVESHLINKIKEKKDKFSEIQKYKVEGLISDFQNRFESCSSAHAKSDGYKFNVLYGHAVNVVVRLVYLCEGAIEHDYMPANFLTDYSYKLDLGIEKLGTMNMQNANFHKRRVLDLFSKYLTKAIKKFGLSLNEKPILSFLESVFERDFFWNYRDISKFNKKIKSGLLYRSSALCLYKNESNLEPKLKDSNITSIVDLRAEREISDLFYDKEQLDSYNIIHAPFDPWNQSIDFRNTYNTGSNAEIAYHFFVRECKDSVKKVIEAILDSNGAINIHCHAGKDRTGIVISLLHLLSGVEEDVILLDYLASEMDTKKEYIQILLDVIDEYGGIHNYLDSCGISEFQIKNLKTKMLN